MPMPVKFSKTDIPGMLLVEVGCVGDDRGFFSEVYSEAVWRDAGFEERFVQDNLSLSAKGTLRGMHYQLEPHGLGKLVRVVRGSIFDVGVDLRKGSPAFGKWVGRTLSAENRLALWLPVGLAHGFLALEDDTLAYYKSTGHHTPEAERSLSYFDPEVGIAWPCRPTIVSPKDAQAPTIERAEHNFEFKAQA